MREELGVLLMENQAGEVAVQLFSEVKGVEAAFDDLSGSPADKPSRATFISLEYDKDGKFRVSKVSSKILPIIEPVDNKPDGFVLGQGPVKFEKEE
jgi:hypothetical protein